VRPNKIRLHVYQGILVSDGEKLRGAVLDLPDQVLAKEAPKELTVRSIYSDRVLTAALTRGLAGPAPQLMLLLADDALEAILYKADEPKLLKPDKIDDDECYRVEIEAPKGTAVFWIDQDTYALRRIDLPTDELRQAIGRGAQLDSISLVVEFKGVRLGGEVDAKAFQFETPPGAKLVTFFVPPHPAQLLGKAVPDFTFTDLDGNPVTPASLKEKIVVMDFWATWCGPCRQSLPLLNKVYEKFKDNEKLAFLAVSVDQPNVENKQLREMLDNLGVRVPVARDLQRQSTEFKISGIPSMFILGPDGIVQDYEIGGNPEVAATLPEKIDKLLAGKNIYEEPLAKYQEQLKSYERAAEETGDQSSGDPFTRQQKIPRAEIAKRSDPKTLNFKSLWKCTELTEPGNILVVPQADGPPQLFVIDGWTSVTQVGADGSVVATHQLKIPQGEVVSFLRTGTAGDGKRYFAGSAPGIQQLHLFDENWDLLLSFPKDVQDAPHAGMADVQLADLNGDGTLELYAGYRGDVGVQGVSLEGERQWSNRSIAMVLGMVVTGSDQKNQRQLLCTCNRGSLVMLDAEGKNKGEVALPNRLLRFIAAADLEGNGQTQYCGLSTIALGADVAVGLTLQGKELWSYELPKGVHGRPIEAVVAGNLSGSPPGQWLLAAADGSIHILAADGNLIDQFNYGAALSGLAVAQLNGRPVLLVAAQGGLEALQVE